MTIIDEMNLTVLAFQVQKQSTDVHHYGPTPEWTFVARFPTLESAQGFVDQHKADYAGDHHRSALRVYCEPKDVAKLMQALAVAKGLRTADWW